MALGETLFFRRSGPFDFACATCHDAKGLRIRLQGLPHLSNPEEARKVVGEWPAYRVSTTHVMTMQHRLYDCYWQMRMPELELGSEASVALISLSGEPGERRRDRRARPQALSAGEPTMRIISIALVADRPARATPALAQQKPAVDPARADAVIKSAFPTAPADWQSRLMPDETHAAVLGAPQHAAAADCRCDPAAREGDDRLSGRRQA